MSKPKVFLSHSKSDIEFINLIDADFRRCHIETWIDEIDIRHGDSWLQAIFEDGIAKNDFVFVLISPNSITSQMVATEIDAGIINQLQKRNVNFLPYITDATLRTRLRLDLQSIQMPELNHDNCNRQLPVVVSNIWERYLSRQVSEIERLKNLEIENLRLTAEIEKAKAAFIPEQEAKFKFIFDALNFDFELTCTINDRAEVTKDKRVYTINAIYGLLWLYRNAGSPYTPYAESSAFIKLLTNAGFLKYDNQTQGVSISESIDFERTLLKYGFLNRNYNPKPAATVETQRSHFFGIRHEYEIFTFSEELDKFNLWMDYRNISVSSEIHPMVS
jgi:hypothetical protein